MSAPANQSRNAAVSHVHNFVSSVQFFVPKLLLLDPVLFLGFSVVAAAAIVATVTVAPAAVDTASCFFRFAAGLLFVVDFAAAGGARGDGWDAWDGVCATRFAST